MSTYRETVLHRKLADSRMLNNSAKMVGLRFCVCCLNAKVWSDPEARFPQGKLAKRWGVSPEDLKDLKAGERIPPIETMENIAKNLDIPLDFLLKGMPEPQWLQDLSRSRDHSGIKGSNPLPPAMVTVRMSVEDCCKLLGLIHLDEISIRTARGKVCRPEYEPAAKALKDAIEAACVATPAKKRQRSKG